MAQRRLSPEVGSGEFGHCFGCTPPVLGKGFPRPISGKLTWAERVGGRPRGVDGNVLEYAEIRARLVQDAEHHVDVTVFSTEPESRGCRLG